MSRDLILGIVDRYNFHKVRKFVRSIRQTAFDGDVVLFVGPKTSDRTVKMLSENGMVVVRFPALGSLPLDNLAPKHFKLPKPINYFNFRHYLYFDYVMRNQGRYENVMLSDVRDVFFQKDPFDFEIGDALCCAVEGPTKTIKECDHNRPWVEFIYGTEGLEKIGDEVISCAGTTWGKTTVVIDYLSRMLSEIEKLDDAVTAIDQAIHNYIIYTRGVDKVRFLKNDEGVVLTLSYEDNYFINELDQVCVGDGRVVGTIHQFPRKPDLLELTDRRFPAKRIDFLLEGLGDLRDRSYGRALGGMKRRLRRV